MTIRTARYILDLIRNGGGQSISNRSIRRALFVTGDLRTTFGRKA
jgi:hypothetical protein